MFRIHQKLKLVFNMTNTCKIGGLKLYNVIQTTLNDRCLSFSFTRRMCVRMCMCFSHSKSLLIIKWVDVQLPKHRRNGFHFAFQRKLMNAIILVRQYGIRYRIINVFLVTFYRNCAYV